MKTKKFIIEEDDLEVPADDLEVAAPEPVEEPDVTQPEEAESNEEPEVKDTESEETPEETEKDKEETSKKVEPEESEKEVKGKYDTHSLGYYQKRKIKVNVDGNPEFELPDDEYKSLINRRFGTKWGTKNQKLRDWIKTSKAKTFWVVNKEDPQKRYLYVAPRRQEKKDGET